jgi:4a-hydroxytetrahydrobiopterin dehydratase
MAQLLSPEDIDAKLTQFPEWGMDQGKSITRDFKFQDFKEAMEFVNKVADEAEEMNHHPDIDIRWNTVTLAISTHSAGGLTENDFELASRCNKLA